MVAQLLQEAHQDGIPDTGRLLDASLAHLQALGHHDKARTLHNLMLQQGWPSSPAYIPYPDTEHEARAEVPTYDGGVEVSGEGADVAASSNSGRPSSSGGCSVASSCCSFGDVPPAALEAGRGKAYQLHQHNHPTGNFTGFVSLPAHSTSDTPETPPATAVQCYSPDSSFSSTCSTVYSCASSSFSTGPAAGRMAYLRTDSVATAVSDRECLSASETPASNSSPVRPMQSLSAPRDESTTAADSSPAADSATEDPTPTEAEAEAAPFPAQPQHTHAVKSAPLHADNSGRTVDGVSTGATSAAVSAGCGMFGPCYAYIPTQGPSGMMYTVAGPYYYDAGGNWFGMSYA
jgi:hypothetical protein